VPAVVIEGGKETRKKARQRQDERVSRHDGTEEVIKNYRVRDGGRGWPQRVSGRGSGEQSVIKKGAKRTYLRKPFVKEPSFAR